MSKYSEILRAGKNKRFEDAKRMISEFERNCIDLNKPEKPTFKYMMTCLEVYLLNKKYEEALATIELIENFWEASLNNKKQISNDHRYSKIALAKIACLIHADEHKSALDEIKKLDSLVLKNVDILNFAMMFLNKDSLIESSYCYEQFFLKDVLNFEAVCSYTDFLYKSNKARKVAPFVIDKFLLIQDYIESIDYVCCVCGYLLENSRDDEVVEIYDFLYNEIETGNRTELLNQNPQTHIDLLRIGFEASYFNNDDGKMLDIGKEICERYADNDPDCVEPRFYCMMAETYYYINTPNKVLTSELCLDYLDKAMIGYSQILITEKEVDPYIITQKIGKISIIMDQIREGRDIDWKTAELWLRCE